MEAVQEQGNGLGRRVEKMDMELKAFFTEQRLFIGEALAGVAAAAAAIAPAEPSAG